MKLQLRLIRRLLHAHIHRAGNLADFVRQVCGDLAVSCLIAPGDLNIERRRQAEIQRLADDVRGQEIKGRARETRGSARARNRRT